MENPFKGDSWCLQNYEWSTTTPGWEKYLHSMSSRSRPNPYSGDIHTGRWWRHSLHWTRRCLEWNPAHRLNTENIFGWQILMWRKKYLRGTEFGALSDICISSPWGPCAASCSHHLCDTAVPPSHASWNRKVLLLSCQLKQKGFPPSHASWNRKVLLLFTPAETKKFHSFSRQLKQKVF